MFKEIANSLAKLSVRACARLCGSHEAEATTPDNPAVHKSLSALLTPYIARKLHTASPADVLKLLNSNSENPYLMWDNATRAELLDFLEKQQSAVVRTVSAVMTSQVTSYQAAH